MAPPRPSFAIANRRKPTNDPKDEFPLTFSSYCSPHIPDWFKDAAITFFPPPPSESSGTTSALTPATETPAPGSPQSSTTSVSHHALNFEQSTPVTPKEVHAVVQDEPPVAPPEVVTEELPPVAPPPAKVAPKSWSALFVKPAPSNPPSAKSAIVTPEIAASSSTSNAMPKSPPRTYTDMASLPSVDPSTLLTKPTLGMLTQPTPLLHPRGLINIGNMCFANTILQILTHTSPFWRTFIQGVAPLFDQVGSMGTGQSQCRLVEATLSFVREFKLAADVELPRDPLPSEGGGGKKAKGKAVSIEEMRNASFNQEAFVPEFLYDAMRENKRFDSMQKGHQEDAEEFLGFFLDTLHEELLFVTERLEADPTPALAPAQKTHRRGRSSATQIPQEEEREVQRPVSPSEEQDAGWMEIGKRNKVIATRTTKNSESVITKIFGGKLRSVLKMPGAGGGKTSATLEPYQPLQLDIEATSTYSIEDALRHITQLETVSVKSSKGVDVSATKQVFIDTLPPILILHVKRFIYDGGLGVIKSQKVIGYGSTLEIPQEALPSAKRTGPPTRYRLYGVVYHHGKHATGGHYTLDVLRQDGSEWLRIDDNHVEPVAEDSVVTTTAEGLRNNKAESARVNPLTGIPDKVAYLLFYKRML